MLKRERVVNKPRELGYKFHREAPSTYVYRKSTHRIFVPKSDLVSESWVRATLFTCGCKPNEAEEFIRIARL